MTISQERNNSYFKGNTTYYSSQESSQIQRKDIKTLLFYHARTLFRDKKLEKCIYVLDKLCLLYTSPSPRDVEESRMPSSA